MRYSMLGKTGMKVSTLGFGCMRLPMKAGKVDRELSTPMLRKAVDMGVNFFDSAVMYCNGDSQAAIGDALKGIREKVFLSTKNPAAHAKPDDWWRIMEDSLRLLQTDYIDLYNQHGIGWETFVKHLDPDKGGRVKEFIKAKEQGLIRHIGFSFHDSPESLIKLVDTGIFENVILQYNLLDQANADAIQYAHEKGMGVVVMGPVGGGRLGLASDQIVELTKGAAKSTVEAALRFVWAHPGVNVALSGMETMAMLEQNVDIALHGGPFTKDQLKGLNSLVEERKKKSGLYCTACRYCMPACEQGVKIPENLELLNQAKIFGLAKAAQERYNWLEVKAVECINCGKCVMLCPQKIQIPEKLRETALLLDPAAGSVVCDASVKELKPDGSFQMSLRLFNFSDKPRDVDIKLSSDTGMQFDNPEIHIPGLKDMGRKTVTVQGKIPVAGGRCCCSAEITYDGKQHILDKVYDCIVVTKGVSNNWASGSWHSAQAKPEDFSNMADVAVKHGLRFKLEYDDFSTALYTDVKDDFLFKSREEVNKGSLCDGLEVYLDGRPPKSIGKSAYEKGVYQVMMYPGTPGTHPAFYSSSQGIEKLTVTSEQTSQGYRIKAVVPFASFCVDPGKPLKIGFDIGVNSADETGNRIGQFIFAGTKNNWRDASTWIEAWLI
jgi:uncharacterized protein